MNRFHWIIAGAAIVLAGCESAPEQTAMASGPVSDAELARLAGDVGDKLSGIDEAEAARLRPYELELRRLSDLLGVPAPRSGPVDASTDVAAGEPEPAPFNPPAAPALEGGRSVFHAVRLGVYPSRQAAEAGWLALAMIHGQALSGRTARIEEQEDGYILKAGPFADSSAATAVCDELKATDMRCAVSDFTGEDF